MPNLSRAARNFQKIDLQFISTKYILKVRNHEFSKCNHTFIDKALTIRAPNRPHIVAKICVRNVKPTHIRVTFKLLLALREEVAATTPMKTTGTMSISSERIKSVPGSTNQSMSSLLNEEFLMPMPMPKPTTIDKSIRIRRVLSFKNLTNLLGCLTVTK